MEDAAEISVVLALDIGCSEMPCSCAEAMAAKVRKTRDLMETMLTVNETDCLDGFWWRGIR
jgi:hypothetical protein